MYSFNIAPHATSEDKAWAELLWECGCTVTLQVHSIAEAAKWLRVQHLGSEYIKALRHPGLSNTFVEFAKLVDALKIEKVKDGKDAMLRWANADYNEAIHKAATILLSVLDDGLVKSLNELDMSYGREVLSNQYSKLNRLCAIAKSSSNGEHGGSSLVAWLVDMLHLAFRCKIQTPSGAVDRWLDRDRKAGLPGFWNASLTVLQAGLLPPHSVFG